jgi:hypothetical protein
MKVILLLPYTYVSIKTCTKSFDTVILHHVHVNVDANKYLSKLCDIKPVPVTLQAYPYQTRDFNTCLRDYRIIWLSKSITTGI